MYGACRQLPTLPNCFVRKLPNFLVMVCSNHRYLAIGYLWIIYHLFYAIGDADIVIVKVTACPARGLSLACDVWLRRPRRKRDHGGWDQALLQG
ncbi:hypothetical protein JTE90_006809 [Oedothorax gibbosus]|uniref:Uncharacterized protein n=1 Tax=Oedothorax gibbosus TaxID=931172 RepID=A0AAV6VP09_9ARAC|nr:hypothetical protein JTE90_006809 [Oedothorax gibbosus]